MLDAPLPIRAEAHPTAEPVATLPMGATARSMGTSVDIDGARWYEVAWGDHRGWVSPAADGSRLAWVTNGRLAVSCTTCGDGRLPQTSTVRPDGSDPLIVWPDYGVPTWAPDGSRLALAIESGLVLVDPDGSNALDLGPGRAPAWSPDGSSIAYADPAAPAVLIRDDAGSGQAVPVLMPATGPINEIDWSPDGARLAVTVADCPSCIGDAHGVTPVAIFVVDLENGTARRMADADTTIVDTTWLVDGSGLAFRVVDMISFGGEIRHLDLATGSVEIIDEVPLGEARSASADGTREVVSRADAVAIVDGELEDVVVPISAGMNPQPTLGRLSPDGQWVLFDRLWITGDLIEAWVVRVDGTDAHQVAEVGYHATWQPILEPLP